MKEIKSTTKYDSFKRLKGNRDVAHKKFQEISKEAIYKANLEAINSIKLRIRIIQNQIDKEWSNITD